MGCLQPHKITKAGLEFTIFWPQPPGIIGMHHHIWPLKRQFCVTEEKMKQGEGEQEVGFPLI